MRADRRHFHGEHHRGQVPERQLEEAAAFAGGGSSGSSPLTTKGDIYVFSTVDDRLPVGTDGYAVVADSGQATGLNYAPMGGGVTRTHYGYDTIGGTRHALGDGETFLKKITPGAGWLAGVSMYVDGAADNVPSLTAGAWSDDSGSPQYLIFAESTSSSGNNFVLGLSSSGPWDARWLWLPMGFETEASTDYWIGAMKHQGSLGIYHDSGSDQQYTSGGNWLADAGRYTVTDSTRKYSLYAVVLT